MMQKCSPGEVYNIGGNRTMTIGEALDILLSFSKIKIQTATDPKLIRPSDVTLQIPSTEKFYAETGWTPQIPFEQTLKDILNYWRNELKISPWKTVTIFK
jgi:nucleoside-diphosphate-sugar epimerase